MAKKASKIRSDPGEEVKPDPAEQELDRADTPSLDLIVRDF